MLRVFYIDLAWLTPSSKIIPKGRMIASCAVNSTLVHGTSDRDFLSFARPMAFEHDILNFTVFAVTDLVKFDQASF